MFEMKYLPQNPRKGAGQILLGLMNRVGKWPTAWVIYWIPFTDFVNREQTTGESPKKGAGTTFFRSDQQIWDLVCVSYHNRRQSGKSSNKGRPDSTFNLLTSISCHQDQVIFLEKLQHFMETGKNPRREVKTLDKLEHFLTNWHKWQYW